MDLTANRRDLLTLATRMANVAERRGTMPVLSHVHLTAKAGQLTMAATDLYLGLTGSIPADITTDGSLAVPAKDFVERVKNMPDGPITLTEKGDSLTFKAKGSARRYTVRCLPGDDFPPLSKVDEGAPSYSLPAATIAKMIAHTIFSVSTDETRAHLNSALFEWEGETVRMVSTDGHRMSKFDVSVPGKVASTSMLIPLKAVGELRRMVDGTEGDITITQSGSSAFFTLDGLTFSVKLVDAKFPPYAQVIPKETGHIAKVSRADLLDAVRAVSVAASERTSGVTMSLAKGKLLLKSESPDHGDGVDEMAVDYAGPKMAIGFNAKYLVDILGALTAEDVEIGATGELDPIVVRAAGDDSFLAIVMPMRVEQ